MSIIQIRYKVGGFFMNKNNIINYVMDNIEYDTEDEKMIQAVENARKEWLIARDYFEMVNDDKLIEYAIFTERAARARFIYLLNQVKDKGIKINSYENMVYGINTKS